MASGKWWQWKRLKLADGGTKDCCVNRNVKIEVYLLPR